MIYLNILRPYSPICNDLLQVFLIVAPLSVLYNWRDELNTWGNFQCVIVHGLRKEEQLARIRNGRTEIALTTHETLRLCLEDFNRLDPQSNECALNWRVITLNWVERHNCCAVLMHLLLCSIDWSAVVVDEAHKLKNPLAQVTQAMKDLRCEVRWLCVALSTTAYFNHIV